MVAKQIKGVAVEFPGYGVYKGKPSQEAVFGDALRVYDHFVKTFKPQKNWLVSLIFPFGIWNFFQFFFEF
jgi:hypothetical protein